VLRKVNGELGNNYRRVENVERRKRFGRLEL
jgi:hypothetical protein